jgi:hypothetical protein
MSDAVLGLIIGAFLAAVAGVALVTYSLLNRQFRKFEYVARELNRQRTHKAWIEKLKTLDPDTPEFEAAVRQRLEEI